MIGERLDYWTLLLGPKFSKRERGAMNLHRFYAVNQIEYCRNFIFKRHFPIHRIFERSCEIGLVAVDRTQDLRDLRQPHHQEAEGQAQHHAGADRARASYFPGVLEARLREAVREVLHLPAQRDLLQQSVRLRPEERLGALGVRAREVPRITDRFATFQAQCLNVHVEFPLLQRLALPITVGTAKFPGIKIHDTRMIRLMEVLLHGGTTVGGWRPSRSMRHRHELWSVRQRYGLNQLRYDLRKMKAHGLLERDGKRYAYRLTDKGKRSLSSSCSSTSGCAALLLTASFTTAPTPLPARKQTRTAVHKADDESRVGGMPGQVRAQARRSEHLTRVG